MTERIALAYLTYAGLGVPEAIDVAAELGCSALGVRLIPAVPGGHADPLHENPALMRVTKARLRETGIRILDVEIVRLTAQFTPASAAPLLDAAAEIGAEAVLVTGADPDEDRQAESFAAFCDAAAPYGITANLEFMSFTAVRDVAAALRIMRAAGRPNGRVLVDALHAARSGASWAEVAAIPRGLMDYCQLCDAPAQAPDNLDGLIHAARHARLLPGEGGLDLDGLLRALPADLPVSIELPNDDAVARLGRKAWVAAAVAATRAALARSDRGADRTA